MDRVILHSDINACYVNIELLYNPELRGRPLAVCGDQESRRGIILAKDELAKRAGVRTGMAIWQARRLCPGLQLIQPHFERYRKLSRQVREIYLQYTDLCEPFGLDECWLDLSGCLGREDGERTAQEIRARVRRETGLTVSVGVSWNKVFAKLGSDYKKPDAVTVISRANYRSLVWPLPASDLLMVGQSTAAALAHMGIRSIGELAAADPELLRRRLGTGGPLLHAYANGLDRSPVRREEDFPPPKSVGSSTTTPRDLVSDHEVYRTFMALAENVGARLRAAGCCCRGLEIELRGADLRWSRHRTRLDQPEDSTARLLRCAMELFRQCHRWPDPLHSLGLRALDLVPAGSPCQLSLFSDVNDGARLRSLDTALDTIRGKYGRDSVHRGGAGEL